MKLRTGVVTFPGSNCDRDCLLLFGEKLGLDTRLHFHSDGGFEAYDLLILPGGFSFGDYLRAGALAARIPAIDRIRAFAAKGGRVLGICNGFQILTEAGLLPGALTYNESHHFECVVADLDPQKDRFGWIPESCQGSVFSFPVAHGQGRYVASPEELKGLNARGQVVWRYRGWTNGSMERIAGICDPSGKILGMMPHPERTLAEGTRWLKAWLGAVA